MYGLVIKKPFPLACSVYQLIIVNISDCDQDLNIRPLDQMSISFVTLAYCCDEMTWAEKQHTISDVFISKIMSFKFNFFTIFQVDWKRFNRSTTVSVSNVQSRVKLPCTVLPLPPYKNQPSILPLPHKYCLSFILVSTEVYIVHFPNTAICEQVIIINHEFFTVYFTVG